MKDKVKIWEECVSIPTYGTGKPEKNPMFLEKRVYQGSSGVVYPYPVIEKIEDTCEEKSYKALFVENKYLKIMVLPELGGRIQMAYDKLKERHFIYYNHVIKPALVGLTGPWISGGIEFNWPQHHRPSTFLPVDYMLEECGDGSAVIWVNERERMFHQKGSAGFKLSPDRAVLEIIGKVSNPTPIPQTFLWWANPAVAVNDYYQSVFPADVNAVFDHGKRDVSEYPIAKGTYYKMDYSAGVDISRYKNIPVPTSFMAVNSKYDFIGGYEHDTRAGVLHIADHNISPGKKQWTWGNGDFGQAWDRNLTDSDGPYIELMTGVYTDNQPDFTWLQPYEEKTFTQYFMPYRELGVVKNANADILMNLEQEDSEWVLKLMVTSEQKGLRIAVHENGECIKELSADIIPESIYTESIPISGLEGVSVSVCDNTGKETLYWEYETSDGKEIPEAARPALLPGEIHSTEQLFLTGLHLEQYRHATYNPTDYYLEALRREPEDIRNNNAMGLWLIRKGQFEKAEGYLRQAVKTMTEKNPNPYDGEPLYNLGLSLKYQGRLKEAYAYFYKACWNAAWQDSGYFSLAQISCHEGNWKRALGEIDKSLLRNRASIRASHLKATILRRLGQPDKAIKFINESLEIDPFNFGCLFEKYLITGEKENLDFFVKLIRKESHNYEELAVDYASAGCWTEAIRVAETAFKEGVDSMMLGYYYSWFLLMTGDTQKAVEIIKRTERKMPDTFFPNALEAIIALETVIAAVESTPKACYLLGNIWYDKRQYPEAIAMWEKSKETDGQFPTVLRNLSLAYFNKLDRKQEAVELLEEAFALDPADARILMELDQLYKRMNYSAEQRFGFLDKHKQVAFERDDLYLEYITLLNLLGRNEKVIVMIDGRKFHPWEGGEGKVPAQYQLARIEVALKMCGEGEYDRALQLVEECYVYPHNLGEGKLCIALENDLDYYKGCILEKMGRNDESVAAFKSAMQGEVELNDTMYYNDQKPDKIFYQGLALRKLNKEEKASELFNRLIEYGRKHIEDKFKFDYFAVSLPDLQIWEQDMDRKNAVHCNYLMGLGHFGVGNYNEAIMCFTTALELDNSHQGVKFHKELCEKQQNN